MMKMMNTPSPLTLELPTRVPDVEECVVCSRLTFSRIEGGYVGHVASGRRLYFCGRHYADAASRREIVADVFEQQIKESRSVFKRRPVRGVPRPMEVGK